MNEIREIPVVRDEYGCWTHPEYEKFCDGREHISTEEFNAWMEENNLQWTIRTMDEDDFDDCYFVAVGCFLKLQIQSLHSVIQE